MLEVFKHLENNQSHLNIIGLEKSSSSLFFNALIKKHSRPLVIITHNQNEALKMQRDFSIFSHDDIPSFVLPSFDAMPYFKISPNPETIIERLNVIYHLEKQAKNPFVLFLPLASCLRQMIPRNIFLSHIHSIFKGMQVYREEFIKKLERLNYVRVPLVEDKGTFAIRGEIIDIFSPQQEFPARLEFFDDEVEKIKTFNPNNQKSKHDINQFDIIPVREIIWNSIEKNWKSLIKNKCDELNLSKSLRDPITESIEQKIFAGGIETLLSIFYVQPGTIFDYLPSETIIIFQEKKELLGQHQTLLENLREDRNKSTSFEKLISPEEIFLHESYWEDVSSLFRSINLSSDNVEDANSKKIEIESNHLLKFKSQNIKHEQILKPLADEISNKLQLQTRVFIICSSEIQKQRIEDLLEPYHLPLREISHFPSSENLWTDPSKKELSILTGSLDEGFYSHELKIWIITDQEIFGKKQKRISKSKSLETFSSFADLSIGDYIVHQHHGVAIYRGLETLEFGSFKNDFIYLEYLGQDKLFVPVDQLDVIARYRSKEGEAPLLDKLGGNSWRKVRAKVKKAAQKLAKELIELQAKRETARGYQYSLNHEIFEEFEASFPFEETIDQESAIRDVIQDMEDIKPMDRLVCGDVGFGKTEVAMRASCKAIIDKKQVALLVPTTILAIQHFENFKKRFENFPVQIEVLSRFQSNSDQKIIIEKLKQGKIDIIIGTHRLLSTDVKFCDLGLLIVDEEHRFGVKQKEKIKRFRNNIDLLTLTATPIPRTLNFSLVGIRDLSIINTPPRDRLAIKTYLTEFDEGSIHEAVSREIKRGGQVYFVHNRVQTIYDMKKRLEKILPEIKIAVGHGQMEEAELEDVMLKFMHKEYDLLLSTTIIESGLDIPSANTIIINRADHLGLAQLYQLRGRVGRSFMRAYCYLVVPDRSLMTKQAQKRLNVIQRFTELGAGFKIASHDLEIRGAGNILGAEQSGHIGAVGYELYIQLLEEAILKLKGEENFDSLETEIKLPLSTRIPEDYIPDTGLRLILYKKASSLKTIEEVNELKEEWLDRFGELPIETNHLLELIKIKIYARKLGVISLKAQSSGILIDIDENSPINRSHLLSLLQTSPTKYNLTSTSSLKIGFKYENNDELMRKIQDELVKLIEIE